MLIKAAINGSRTRSEHPAVPITAEEQGRAARGAAAAGAGAVHVHVRGADGLESLRAEDLARTLRVIRAAVPGLPIGVSTGAWIVPDPGERLRAVAGWTSLPDFASVNFIEAGAGPLAELLLSRGVPVEAGLSEARAAEVFLACGLAGRCVRVLLEPQEADVGEALRTAGCIEVLLDQAGVAPPRLLHGTGGTAWRLVREAARRGLDTRIGLEDTLTLPDGRVAEDNAILIKEAIGIVKSAGRT